MLRRLQLTVKIGNSFKFVEIVFEWNRNVAMYPLVHTQVNVYLRCVTCALLRASQFQPVLASSSAQELVPCRTSVPLAPCRLCEAADVS